MLDWINGIYDWVTASAMSPWALVVLFALCVIDSVIPPFPSESIVTALAAILIKTDPPRVLLVLVLAALGAWCGDNLAYLIGRRLHRLLSRKPELEAKVHEAAGRVRKRGTTVIVTGRFIPVGRVLINMGAGLAEFPHRRFMLATVASTSVWSLYSVSIGVLAGHWIQGQPVLGAAIGVAIGITLGVVVDKVLTRFQSRQATRVTVGAGVRLPETPAQN